MKLKYIFCSLFLFSSAIHSKTILTLPDKNIVSDELYQSLNNISYSDFIKTSSCKNKNYESSISIFKNTDLYYIFNYSIKYTCATKNINQQSFVYLFYDKKNHKFSSPQLTFLSKPHSWQLVRNKILNQENYPDSCFDYVSELDFSTIDYLAFTEKNDTIILFFSKNNDKKCLTTVKLSQTEINKIKGIK